MTVVTSSDTSMHGGEVAPVRTPVPTVGLATIGLEELRATADLQSRRDRKYVVDPAGAAEVLAGLYDDLRVLEVDGRRTFRYETVYFDTPDLALFHQAAHRRPRRAKVRVRTYCDSGDVALEVKLREPRGLTVKHRRRVEPSDAGQWSPHDRAWVLSHDVVADAEPDLAPSLVARYRRTTFLVPGSNSRLTLDQDLVVVDPRADTPATFAFNGIMIIETKSAGRATDVDRALWRHGLRPDRISKYGTGLAALHGSLPSNAWHRVLGTRHADDATTSPGRSARNA